MRHHLQPIRRAEGFTLIEVMIVVAVVAILAALAYPSYLESINKSRRAEARAQLLDAAQYMQRFYSQNDRFDRAIGAEDPVELPDALRQVPRQGAQNYTIGFVEGSLTPSSFTLEAVRTGSMTKDRCGTLRLSNTGRKSIDGAAEGMAVEDCWR